jgi:hypothetical protein
MNVPKLMVAGSAAVLCFAMSVSQAQVEVNVGPAPACPYGYFEYPPYACAPYGYYGPDWFTGGIFIGAGPWFHGPANFRGHVDAHFDTRNGYKGPVPARGEHMDPARPVDHMDNFHGAEMHDGHGHIAK